MSQNNQAISILDKFALFNDQWQPRVIASMNDYQFKIAKIEGEFVWHEHANTDEVFIIMQGELSIELTDQTVHLKTGDMYVVPKGVQHKPIAEKECWLLLVEPEGTLNTGEQGGDRTAKNDIWI